MKIGKNSLQGMRYRYQVVLDKIMATSQRHLASALKILTADTKIHRNLLKVSVF